MNIEEVREYGLSLPKATERCPFGPDTLSLEIGGRIFCLMTLDGQWSFYNLKVDPELGIELCERYAGIRPGYHMNKRHWISVEFDDDVSPSLQKALIRHAYNCTLSKISRKARMLAGLPDPTPLDKDDAFIIIHPLNGELNR